MQTGDPSDLGGIVGFAATLMSVIGEWGVLVIAAVVAVIGWLVVRRIRKRAG